MLLWRFSSYYIPVIAGALVFLGFKNHADHEKFKKVQAWKNSGQNNDSDKDQKDSTQMLPDSGSTDIKQPQKEKAAAIRTGAESAVNTL